MQSIPHHEGFEEHIYSSTVVYFVSLQSTDVRLVPYVLHEDLYNTRLLTTIDNLTRLTGIEASIKANRRRKANGISMYELCQL